MIYWNCIFIAVIAVLIIDLSGFVENFKRWFSRFLTGGQIENSNYRIRPFDCSFCVSWWANLIYIICVHSLSFGMIAFVLFLAFLTPVFKNLLIFIQGFAIKVINELSEHFNI